MPVQAVRTADRVALMRPTAVNCVLAEVRALQSQGRTLVSLMRGEPDFPTPGHITEAAASALRSGRTNYPDNRGEMVLREAVAAKLERDNGLRYNPQTEILITDGATLGVYAALMTVAGPGNEVLLPDPVYDAYRSPVRLTGACPRPVASTRENGRFTLTVEALEAAWTPAVSVLLLNTPWNPVGTVFTRPELEAIAAFVERHNLWLISDEIYESITYGDRRHISPASLSPSVQQRCILINSFSKTYSMTGWRLGYSAAPGEIVNAMLLVLQQSSRGPATFIQHAGAAALTGPQDCVMQMRDTYAQRRELVTNALSGIADIEVLPPDGGFFTMVDVSNTGLTSNEVRQTLLYNHNIVVIHGGAYGKGGEGTLRVSFATGGDNLARGLDALRRGLGSL